jgi:hypothetical protein
MAGNYDIQLENCRRLFAKTHSGQSTPTRVRFLSREWTVNPTTGVVSSGGEEADFNVSLSIYDYLSGPGCPRPMSGRKLPLGSNAAHPGVDDGFMLRSRAQRYAETPEKFSAACRSLGGIPYPVGDAGYEIEIFPGLTAVVQLWLGDDEFPATLRILWDEDVLTVIKYETAWYVAAELLRILDTYF